MSGCRFYTILAVIIAFSIIRSESKTAEQLLQCFSKSVPVQPLSHSLQNICLEDTKDKNCPKTVLGMRECFILNECYSKPKNEDMDVHCWNCWVDYTTDSHVVQDYQQKFRKCNWSENVWFGLVLILSLVLAVVVA